MSVVSLPDAQGFCLRELVIMPGDVMTVGEAFARCDARLLLSAVLSAEAGWRDRVPNVGVTGCFEREAAIA